MVTMEWRFVIEWRVNTTTVWIYAMTRSLQRKWKICHRFSNTSEKWRKLCYTLCNCRSSFHATYSHNVHVLTTIFFICIYSSIAWHHRSFWTMDTLMPYVISIPSPSVFLKRRFGNWISRLNSHRRFRLNKLVSDCLVHFLFFSFADSNFTPTIN